MVLTVKRLKEKLEAMDENLLVGYVDPYSKFHPISVDDVYVATGHYDPSGSIDAWQDLLTETKPKRVVHLNVPQVGVPKRRT